MFTPTFSLVRPITSPYLTLCLYVICHYISGLSIMRTIVDPRLKYPIYSPISYVSFSFTTIRPTFNAPTNIIPKYPSLHLPCKIKREFRSYTLPFFTNVFYFTEKSAPSIALRRVISKFVAAWNL